MISDLCRDTRSPWSSVAHLRIDTISEAAAAAAGASTWLQHILATILESLAEPDGGELSHAVSMQHERCKSLLGGRRRSKSPIARHMPERSGIPSPSPQPSHGALLEAHGGASGSRFQEQSLSMHFVDGMMQCYLPASPVPLRW